MPRLPRQLVVSVLRNAWCSVNGHSTPHALPKSLSTPTASSLSYLSSLSQLRLSSGASVAQKPSLLLGRSLPSFSARLAPNYTISPKPRQLVHPLSPQPSTSTAPSTPILSLLTASNTLNLASSPFAVGGQVRFAARGTEYQPSQRKRKRKFGFLARQRSKAGRKILARRLAKGRRYLSH